MNATTPSLAAPAAGMADAMDDMAALRRDLHAHPELGFQEVRTSDIVAARLASWGIPVHRGMGRTGVVGILKRGSSTRAVGLRADMDALPIQELNTFAHASTHAGRMHACGHDGHTAILLAAAQQLARQQDHDGTIYLIFQPAEEGGGGGRAMIEDGLFERFPMQAVFGLHNDPGLEPGQFAISPGPVLAATARFKLTIHGKGGHAAAPHRTVDPLPAGAAVLQALQTLVSRNTDPTDAAVVSVTMFHAGTAPNVIPDRCELQGSVRTFSRELRTAIGQRMRQLADGVCAGHGATAELDFIEGYPATVNAGVESAFAREVMVQLVGEANVKPQCPSLGAEDFAYMLEAIPGAYCHIGNGGGDHRLAGHGMGPCELHNPSYDFNDSIIGLGAAYWVALARKWLSVR